MSCDWESSLKQGRIPKTFLLVLDKFVVLAGQDVVAVSNQGPQSVDIHINLR